MALAVRNAANWTREEKAQLKQWGEQMWASLPDDYQWLKDWEYV